MPLPPVTEMDALEDLFNSCGGDYWIWNGHGMPWTFSDENYINNQSNPCGPNKWEGIECSCNNDTSASSEYFHPYAFPNGIYYYDDDYNKPSTSFTAACSIEKIFLIKHNLAGSQCSLPSSMGKLRNLTHLHLAQNRIEGAIPEELSALSSLQLLEFGSNLLTGTIPSSLSMLINLRFLVFKYQLYDGHNTCITQHTLLANLS